MRRSICMTTPHVTYAGETTIWKFSFTTANVLPKGAKLKFDLQSKGRQIDWKTPEPVTKPSDGGIWAMIGDDKFISAKALDSGNAVPDFEFTIPEEIKIGDTFTVCMQTQAQTIVQRRRTFFLYIDPKGKGDYKDPEFFSIDIKGSFLHTIKVVAPSIISKNKRFDMVLRFEDQFGNLTNNAPEGTLIELTYEHLRENLSWKLFIPETGFLTLPNLYFNEPGVYNIQLENIQTKQRFYSHPIQCFAEQELSLFWGLLHGESERVDASENIESCLRHLRDEKSLQFFGSSPFENIEETSNEAWKTLSSYITEFNEDARFTTLLGMQWFSELPEEGLRTFVFAKDGKAILRKKDAKNSDLKKIYKGLTPKELISIPSFSMAKKIGTNFTEFSPDFERVVEIYNAWGSSECLEKEGNLRPISSKSKSGVSESPEGSIRKALQKGLRFGFVAGGFDDRGVFSDLYESDQVQYSPGLTAILAPEQSRESLFQALYNRQCYATTGERIILGFFIAGSPMGTELSTKTKPGLSYNRYITGYVAGVSPIREIQFIRGGTVFHTLYPNKPHTEFAFDDPEMLEKVAIHAELCPNPFIYYYVRVVQEDGHLAWSSPIWIDIDSSSQSSLPPKKTKKK